jgi:hypothetical protein
MVDVWRGKISTTIRLDEEDVRALERFAEEYFAGIERELRPRLSVKAHYIRRNTRNTLGYVDTGSTWTSDRIRSVRSVLANPGCNPTQSWRAGSRAQRFASQRVWQPGAGGHFVPMAMSSSSLRRTSRPREIAGDAVKRASSRLRASTLGVRPGTSTTVSPVSLTR